MSMWPRVGIRVGMAVLVLLVACTGLATATAEPRFPRVVEQWDCTIRALGVGTYASTVPPGPWGWSGAGRVTCPTVARWLIITLTVVEDVPDGPDRMTARRKSVHWFPPGTDILLGVDAGTCYPGGLPPVNPAYLRMKVHLRGDPDAVWLASRSRANPCGARGGPVPPAG
jgi:hypothetical protein